MQALKAVTSILEKKSPESVQKQFYTFDGPLPLESGATLGPITIAYETYGTPNVDRSNAILITHALTGDSHAAGFYPDPPAPGHSASGDSQSKQAAGWWHNMIGPGKAFDTSQYWIICANILGGCQGSTGPSSINPKTGRPYGLDFPVVTVGDMVEAQARLMDYLGIQQLYAVAGGSLGGFQALEWSLRFPDRVGAVICLASGYKLSAQGIAFNAVGRYAITSDPNWKEGQYYSGETSPDYQPFNPFTIQYGLGSGPDQGLATARMLAHITYLSEQSLENKFGRRLQSSPNLKYEFSAEFAVESYLDYQGKKFISRFDANSYLYITKAMDYFDLERQYGPLHDVFSRAKAKFLLISFSTDWLFPTLESRKIIRALRQNHLDASFIEVDSPFGHDAFLLEPEQLTRIIQPFLNHVPAIPSPSRRGRGSG